MLECNAVQLIRRTDVPAKSASIILSVHAAVLQIKQQVPLKRRYPLSKQTGVTPQNIIIFCYVTPCSVGESTKGQLKRTAFIFSGSSWSVRNILDYMGFTSWKTVMFKAIVKKTQKMPNEFYYLRKFIKKNNSCMKDDRRVRGFKSR
jgi:hypothetical protein